MTDHGLVCICIPTYERPDLFRECLDSVLSQTYENVSVYIYDNSATNSVFDIIEEKKDMRINYERNNYNISDMITINHRKAFAPKDGVYQMVLTSDWALRPDAIELMVNSLHDNSEFVGVTSGFEFRNKHTGEIRKRPRRLGRFSPKGKNWIDTKKLIHASFRQYSGVGVCYHSLIITDVLRHGMIDQVYYGQATEHEAGLDLLFLKSKLGVIHECLLIGFVDTNHYDTEHWRNDKIFSEALARARFFDRHYPELIAKGFNTEQMRRGLIHWFLRAAFTELNQAGGALLLAKHYGLPWGIAAVLWWILLPLRAYNAIPLKRDSH